MDIEYYVFYNDELLIIVDSFLKVLNVIFDAYQKDNSGEYWFIAC